MRPHPRSAFGAAALLRLAFGWLLCVAALSAAAQDDPPGRVGRIASLNGGVAWWDDEAGQWADADRNRPLTTGDRISTAASGRAELRIGSTVLRLSNSTEAELVQIDDERIVVQLHSGALALRVRSREVADEIELVTAEAVLRPLGAGHYRLDRIDDTTRASVWRGELRVEDAVGVAVTAGQTVELVRAGRRDAPGELRSAFRSMPDDGFTEWVVTEDRQDERTASSRYVSPEMTGAEDLDRAGRWDQHPEYGAIWTPLAVQADWAPYRYGRWAWVSPWGWTWIDDAPWGFAPFHYGRWVSWSGRWGWVPGAYVARPVYAPALVAWLGGGSWGVSLQIGGGPVGWVPLAPREVYRPHYRHSPRYVERVNPHPPYRWQHPPGQPPREPVSYGNQGVPNAVTVVPRDVLQRRQPVSRAVIDLPRDGRGPGQRPWVAAEPPAAPTHGLVGGARRGAEPGRPLLPRRDDRWPQRDARPPQGAAPREAQPSGQSPAPRQPPTQQPAGAPPERGFGDRTPWRGQGGERGDGAPQRQPDRAAPHAPLAVPTAPAVPAAPVVIPDRAAERPAHRPEDGNDRSRDRPSSRGFDRAGDRADRNARRDDGNRDPSRELGRQNRESPREMPRESPRENTREAPPLRAPAAPQAAQPAPQPAVVPAAQPPAPAPMRQPLPQVQPQAQPQAPVVAPRAPSAEPPRERVRGGGDDDRKRIPEGPRDRRERESVR